MTFDELQALIVQGESDTLEFKKSTAQLPRVAEALCGFLNHQGGVVVIGVTDSGQIVGQHVNDGTRQEIAHMLSQFEPPAQVDVDYILLPRTDRYVIALTVGGLKRTSPYIYNGRAYQRVQTTTAVMPQVTYERLLLERLQQVAWEDLPARTNDISQLDEQAIRQTVQGGIQAKRLPVTIEKLDVEEILLRLKLIQDGHLTNAAMVLYAKDQLPAYPQCQLRLARFRGLDKREFVDNQVIEGHAFKLLDEAFFFMNKHLPIAGKVVPGQLERQEETVFPHNAVREALVNAICHRNYTIYGGSIHLAIFDDRLEIWSPGGLPFGQQAESLKHRHTSQPRNPAICNVFYRYGLVETWGRGTQDIIDYSLEMGNPEPLFFEQANAFCVQFDSRIPLGPYSSLVNRLSQRQRDILNLLKRGPLSLRAIWEGLDASPSTKTIAANLAELKALGFIDNRGHGRGAVWYLA